MIDIVMHYGEASQFAGETAGGVISGVKGTSNNLTPVSFFLAKTPLMQTSTLESKAG